MIEGMLNYLLQTEYEIRVICCILWEALQHSFLPVVSELG